MFDWDLVLHLRYSLSSDFPLDRFCFYHWSSLCLQSLEISSSEHGKYFTLWFHVYFYFLYTFITSYITNVKLLIVSKNILSFNFEEVSPKSIRIKFIFSQIVSYIVDWRHLWVLGPIRLQNLHRCWCWSYLTLGLDSINLGFLFFNVGILGWWLNISEAN